MSDVKGRAQAGAALFSVILAARNEAGYIGACLDALLAQDAAAGPLEIVVVVNASSDGTASQAQARAAAAAARGWQLTVLDLAEGGKPLALNAGDSAARGGMRAYLDADVICAPELFGRMRAALARPDPVYVTGQLQVARAKSPVTRAYARIWVQLPFMQSGAVGAGLFAVNAAGRARWGAFAAIISDDTYVRLLFTPAERVEVAATYHWPMVEGFAALVRVRRRQDAGVREIHRLYPGLVANEGKAPPGGLRLAALALRAPLGFAVYLAVHLAVRLRPAGSDWARGR